MTILRSRIVKSPPGDQHSKHPIASSSTEQPANSVAGKQLVAELDTVCDADGNDSATEDAAMTSPIVGIKALQQPDSLSEVIPSTSMTEKTDPLRAQQRAIASDTLVERPHVAEHTKTDIVDTSLQGELAEEFGCKVAVVIQDADHDESATCDMAADINPHRVAGDHVSVTSESQLAVAESEPDSSSESQGKTGYDSRFPILVSEDEADDKTTHPVRRRPQRAAKRSFNEYLANDNLWMGQTVKDIDGFIGSTRKQIKSLQNLERRLLATKTFVQDCGVKEDKITQVLERSG